MNVKSINKNPKLKSVLMKSLVNKRNILSTGKDITDINNPISLSDNSGTTILELTEQLYKHQLKFSVNTRKSALIVFIFAINAFIFSPYAIFSQNQLELSFPNEARNGHFFIKTPKHTDKFFLFGNTIQSLDTSNQSLHNMVGLPSDISYKENASGYTAPNSHMDIFMLDEQTWWMVHKNDILKTMDAGKSWQQILSLTPNTQYTNSSYFTSIHFPSENVGYAVGTADKIFRTFDGGKNWEELQWSISTAPYRRLNDVYFVTESVGFAKGYEVDDILLNIGIYRPMYYFTTDAGKTWTETSFPESDHHYMELQVVEESTWYLSLINRNYIAPNDKLFKSIDGGKKWEEVKLPNSSSISTVIRDMHWFNPDEGLILGSTEIFGNPNHIYKTYNGGESWLEISLDQGNRPFFGKISNIAMEFINSHGIIAGATGNLLYTNDKGETWSTIQKGYPDVYDISSDSNYIYAALYGNILIKKDKSGWSEIQPPHNTQHENAAFEKVTNLGENQVALKDIYGEIHYSKDGGDTWNNIFPELENRVLDIQFVNNRLAALVFSNNQLLYYSDVEDQQDMELIIDGTPLPASVFDLFYLEDIVFARVESFLFKRVDKTWEQVFFNDAFIRSLLMDDKGNAIMRFQSNDYYYSNDIGQTWQEINFSEEILSRIDFTISSINGYGRLNDTTHYALVYGSSDIEKRFETYLILSFDGGENWELVNSKDFSEPNELGHIGHTVDKDGTLWIGSANGNIYRWIFDETAADIEESIESEIIVYPNPAKDFISINSSIGFTTYQLYDWKGQIINTGNLIGISEIIVPLQQPAGVYFLHLITITGENKIVKVIKI